MAGDTSQGSRLPFPNAFARREAGILAGLAAVVFLLYGNTFSVPWYFDDVKNILEWPELRHLGQAFSGLVSPRGAAKFSFALNYFLGGIAPAGYHLVNIGIHAGSSVIFFLVLKRLFPGFPGAPVLGALLFAVHPIQTQAVTYVVQRMTSLAGFFFLLALYLYIRFREEGDRSGARAYGAGAFLAGALAVLTKENAVVLPAAIFLYDRYFLERSPDGIRRSFMRALPFAVVPALVAVFFYGLPLMGGRGLLELSSPDNTLVSSRALSPLTYFVTQFGVIWTYLRLLVLPYGQALDYAYPVARQLFTAFHAEAGLGLAGLLFLAWYLRGRAPRISFGMAWFFLTLAVESSFIPLDPLFEHRLYLPLAGFVIVVLDLAERPAWRRGVLFFLGAVIAVYAALTWERNALWRDPVAFHEDNLRRAPQSERVRLALSQAYIQRGRYDDAERVLREAIRINPRYQELYVNLSKIYVDGRREEAREFLESAIKLFPGNASLYYHLGAFYNMRGDAKAAWACLQRAIALDPYFGRAYSSRGALSAGQGRWPEAEADYRRALYFLPDDALTHYNLGVALANRGRIAGAQAEFYTAHMLDPRDQNALFNLALASFRLGNTQSARLLLPRLREMNGALAAKLEAELARTQ